MLTPIPPNITLLVLNRSSGVSLGFVIFVGWGREIEQDRGGGGRWLARGIFMKERIRPRSLLDSDSILVTAPRPRGVGRGWKIVSRVSSVVVEREERS